MTSSSLLNFVKLDKMTKITYPLKSASFVSYTNGNTYNLLILTFFNCPYIIRLSPGVSKAGVQRFGNHYYYFSWLDSDFQLSRGSWSWFNARNYCRKRCMDLVSFETPQEWDWVRGFMDGEIMLCCNYTMQFIAVPLTIKG